MIKSMTGFGRGSVKIEGGQINVEIQSLNSSYLDIRFVGFNLSPETENNLRRIIFDSLKRGVRNSPVQIERRPQVRRKFGV